MYTVDFLDITTLKPDPLSLAFFNLRLYSLAVNVFLSTTSALSHWKSVFSVNFRSCRMKSQFCVSKGKSSNCMPGQLTPKLIVRRNLIFFFVGSSQSGSVSSKQSRIRISTMASDSFFIASSSPSIDTWFLNTTSGVHIDLKHS